MEQMPDLGNEEQDAAPMSVTRKTPSSTSAPPPSTPAKDQGDARSGQRGRRCGTSVGDEEDAASAGDEAARPEWWVAHTPGEASGDPGRALLPLHLGLDGATLKVATSTCSSVLPASATSGAPGLVAIRRFFCDTYSRCVGDTTVWRVGTSGTTLLCKHIPTQPSCISGSTRCLS